MKKTRKLLVVLAAFIAFTFAAGTIEASAVVSKTSSKKSTSSVKKTTASKKTAVKKKTTKKRTAAKKKSSRKRYIYSRGSGAPIATGDANEVVSVAKKYLGSRYVYGGSSPRGFDCSGFAKYVYSKVGVSLPRTADGQAAKGLAIKKVSDLKPGDLVFFETYAPGISHVGIYIGDGKFIHASNPREGVKITSINSTTYAADFRGGTRILK
jgi:cell wall-associated NlpC family hydrolase